MGLFSNLNVFDITSGLRAMLPKELPSSWCRYVSPMKEDAFVPQPLQLQSKPPLLEPAIKRPLVRTNFTRPQTQLAKRTAVWKAAKENNHSVFFEQVRQNPELLNMTDRAGNKPLDLMSDSPRKDQLLKILEPLMKKEQFFDAVAVQEHVMKEPIWQAAKDNDHGAFFAEVQKKPEVLNMTDEAGNTPLDLMPESRRKTALYESVKHLLKQDVFVDAVEHQPGMAALE